VIEASTIPGPADAGPGKSNQLSISRFMASMSLMAMLCGIAISHTSAFVESVSRMTIP
jgi:hypothetical protein